MVRPMDIQPRSTITYAPTSPACAYLRKVDERMGEVIDEVGQVRLDIEADGFTALARAICDQQISNSASRAIWGRLRAATNGCIDAQHVAGLSQEELHACGFSQRKIGYLCDLARRSLDGRLSWELLAQLPDEEAIAQLITIKGIGRWTAQMYLIFALARPDVFALADGGLRRATARLAGIPADVPDVVIDDIASLWSPYRTAAALYLWAWNN